MKQSVEEYPGVRHWSGNHHFSRIAKIPTPQGKGSAHEEGRFSSDCFTSDKLGASCVADGCLCAAAHSPPPDPAALEKRVADLEAYINNGARGDEATSKVAVPGPGHNGFMMVCAALVLFMTMPGLALFYGGLVRSKNVLSIMAQCMGIAGLVALLWWAFGYSVAFAPGSPFLGGFDMAMLKGVGAAPNTTYAAWVSQDVLAIRN